MKGKIRFAAMEMFKKNPFVTVAVILVALLTGVFLLTDAVTTGRRAGDMEDPVDFVFFLADQTVKEDWKTIQRYLPQVYHGHEKEVMERCAAYLIVKARETGWEEFKSAYEKMPFEEEEIMKYWERFQKYQGREHWVAVDYDKWTAVRPKDSHYPVILRRDTETVWRLDPGPLTRRDIKVKLHYSPEWEHYISSYFITDETVLQFRHFLYDLWLEYYEGLPLEEKYSYILERLIFKDFISIETGSDAVLLSVGLMYNAPSLDVKILTGKLTWTGAGKSGDVTIDWTTARPQKDLLLLPSTSIISFKLHGAGHLDTVKLKVPLVINGVAVTYFFEFEVKDAPV